MVPPGLGGECVCLSGNLLANAGRIRVLDATKLRVPDAGRPVAVPSVEEPGAGLFAAPHRRVLDHLVIPGLGVAAVGGKYEIIVRA